MGEGGDRCGASKRSSQPEPSVIVSPTAVTQLCVTRVGCTCLNSFR
jgi:hypothetical protein